MGSHKARNVDRFEFEEKWWEKLNDFGAVFLAEGDSWFSYGSLQFRNLLLGLKLPYKALILNIAQPGDTLRRMEDTCKNPELYWYLRNQSGRRWDGIFLSGGGNDLIDAAWDEKAKRSWIFVRPADPARITKDNLRDVVDRDACVALYSYIQKNVRHIVEEGRDQAGGNSVNVPMFMHTYALVQPRNSAAKLLAGIKKGPWLYPACRWLGIDESLWIEVARMVLGDLAEALKSLSLPNFHVIDTLSLTTDMIPADPGSTKNSKDWDNEIHPNKGGYRKLAATWSEKIVKIVLV